jgi:hypothetical protein
MILYECIVAIILLAWLILTVAFHYPLTGNYQLRAKDYLGLVPDWRFFCPTPIKNNYFILYRDFINENEITNWTELTLCPPRYFYHVLWNPGRKYRKSYLDVCIEIIGISSRSKESEDYIVGSISYLSILNHISRIPRNSKIELTQFAVMTRSSIDKNADTVLAFLSKVHKI